jgi:hypothetical protein
MNLDNRNQLRDYLLTLRVHPRICEVGVRRGIFFHQLLASNVELAVAVDIWRETGKVAQNDLKFSQQELEGQYKNFKDLYESDERVRIVRDFSVEASKLFPDLYFDLVYLDADHTYESTLADLKHWYPKVKEDGILAGHDYKDFEYNGVVYGVKEAVSTFRESRPDISLSVTKEEFPSFILSRKKI